MSTMTEEEKSLLMHEVAVCVQAQASRCSGVSTKTVHRYANRPELLIKAIERADSVYKLVAFLRGKNA